MTRTPSEIAASNAFASDQLLQSALASVGFLIPAGLIDADFGFRRDAVNADAVIGTGSDYARYRRPVLIAAKTKIATFNKIGGCLDLAF